MGQPGLITMSMRELDRLKVVEAVIEQRLMPWRAAERLGISRRHIERLVARYRGNRPFRAKSGGFVRNSTQNHRLSKRPISRNCVLRMQNLALQP
ncbi:helix-turn-helix domain-containing protein, partial [Burkholderia vietnamiensis]|uniref:helix-turn-helix domain-containing protein n=1 Tax=Burkholderia vietnamiensis TaxID=60552 RepID=UPI003F51027C